MIIAAIDPSLSSTALFWGDGKNPEHEVFLGQHIGDTPAARIARYEHLVNRIDLSIADIAPEAVFLEGYSYGSKRSLMTQAKLYEFGGILRWHLTDRCGQVIEVPPATLKKFATGKGNASKDIVVFELRKRYGVNFVTDDEFDAFGLYQLGRVAMGLAKGANAQQRAAAATLKEVIHGEKESEGDGR